MNKIFFALAPLVLLATGFTNCNYFSEVPIPAEDTSLPIPIDTVWNNGNYVVMNDSDNPGFLYDVPNPTGTVFAVSAALDDGGVYQLSMSGKWRSLCCDLPASSGCNFTAPGPGSLAKSGAIPAQFDEQTGNVGDSVSNGLALVQRFWLPTCPAGKKLKQYELSWQTTVEDFHGNKAQSKLSTMRYIAP